MNDENVGTKFNRQISNNRNLIIYNIETINIINNFVEVVNQFDILTIIYDAK